MACCENCVEPSIVKIVMWLIKVALARAQNLASAVAVGVDDPTRVIATKGAAVFQSSVVMVIVVDPSVVRARHLLMAVGMKKYEHITNARKQHISQHLQS